MSRALNLIKSTLIHLVEKAPEYQSHQKLTLHRHLKSLIVKKWGILNMFA